MIITLPRNALKYLDDEKIEIEIDNKQMENIKPFKPDIKAIQEASGILSRLDIDGKEYQKQIRAEWDER